VLENSGLKISNEVDFSFCKFERKSPPDWLGPNFNKIVDKMPTPFLIIV
jgi:hypothetical protein